MKSIYNIINFIGGEKDVLKLSPDLTLLAEKYTNIRYSTEQILEKNKFSTQSTKNGSSSTLLSDEFHNFASTSFSQNSFSPERSVGENVNFSTLHSEKKIKDYLERSIEEDHFSTQPTKNGFSSTLRSEESLKFYGERPDEVNKKITFFEKLMDSSDQSVNEFPFSIDCKEKSLTEPKINFSKLSDFSERSVDEDQFAVVREGKINIEKSSTVASSLFSQNSLSHIISSEEPLNFSTLHSEKIVLPTLHSCENVNFSKSIAPINKFKHIVMSGGGAAGFSFLGVIQETYNRKMWDYDTLKTIYATSVGAIAAFTIALNLGDFNNVINYFIERPWEQIFHMNGNFLQYFYDRGILGIDVVKEMFAPLLKYKEYDQEITLLELYNKTGIEIHCFTVELNSFTLIDMSYKSHPNYKMIDVIYCSICLPILFQPYNLDNKFYIDGGCLCNYPLYQCIKDHFPSQATENGSSSTICSEKSLNFPSQATENGSSSTICSEKSLNFPSQATENGSSSTICSEKSLFPENKDDILGINIYDSSNSLNENNNLFEYLTHLISLLIYKVRTLEEKKIYIKNEIIISDYPSLHEIIDVMGSSEKRKMLLKKGVDSVKQILRDSS